MKEAEIENKMCGRFEDFEECASDRKFCLLSCHFMACLYQSIDANTLLKDHHMVSKQWPDTEVQNLCPTNTSAVRYELSVGENQVVPALMIFVMTILSGLLALFVVIVLHYNCMVSVRGRAPYRLPCMLCCKTSPCELFFPYYIDEESIKRLLLDREGRKQTTSSAASHTTGRVAEPLNTFNFDIQSPRSVRSDSEIGAGEIQKSKLY